jgi:DNA polymerase-3 subunit delta
MPQIKPNQLAASLQQKLRAVYAVAGDEPLLVMESLDHIRAAAKAAGFVERTVLEVEKGFVPLRLLEACQEMSLFASAKVVELRLLQLPDAKLAEQIVALVSQPMRDVLLLISAGSLDYRVRKSAWWLSCESHGVGVYAESVRDFSAWIIERTKSLKLRLTAEAVESLALRTEGNLLACWQDLQKLKILHGEAVIDEKALQAAVVDSAKFDAFDWVEKILLGDSLAAVHSLERLRQEGLSVPELLGALTYALRLWALAASKVQAGSEPAAALMELKIFGARQPPYLKALQRSRAAHVQRFLQACLKIDRWSKSTGMEPAAWEELTRLVVAASGGAWRWVSAG